VWCYCLFLTMTYDFDTLYKEFLTRQADRRPDKEYGVLDFVNYCLGDICVSLDNGDALTEKQQFLWDYIQANYSV